MARTVTRLLPFALLGLLAAATPRAAGIQVSHLHNLADFHGIIPYNHVKLFFDPAAAEVYVLDRNLVRVFNESGMEIYRFDADAALGTVSDLVVDEDGKILMLSWAREISDRRQFRLTRCDYRGKPLETVALGGIPPEFSPIRPTAMLYRDGWIYLVDTIGLLGVVLDEQGAFQRGYDFAELFRVEGDRANTKIAGVGIDPAGNLLLSVPVDFQAYVVSPAGQVIGALGQPGSGPGKFGIPGGIAADESGHYFVSEKLRSVVMVFDRSFNFVTEFGRLGEGSDNLVIPDELAAGGAGKLYVAQLLDRGVSVFSMKPE